MQRCDHTIFSKWEWLSAWWKHLGTDKKLILLLAEENGKIFGIAPLMYSVQTMFGLRRGKIEFVGTPHTDYNNFILTERKQECLKLFIDYLHNLTEKWDCIDLADIPENAECLPFLIKISKNLIRFHKCPYLPLPKSYENFLENLSFNKRKHIKHDTRRLEKTFHAEIVDYSQPQTCNEGMNYLFKLHQKRWQSVGFAGAFADPNFRKFHLDIAKSFSQKNWLGLYVLKLSGKPAAVMYGFQYKSKYHSYLLGFDPKYSRYGVGNILKAYQINHFIQKGLTEFDMLRGSEWHKDSWHAIPRWNYQAILTKAGIRSSIQHWLYNEYWHQGNRLKYVMKLTQ